MASLQCASFSTPAEVPMPAPGDDHGGGGHGGDDNGGFGPHGQY